MSLVYVTEHFSWQEFACHDGQQVPDSWRPNVRTLCMTVLEPIRARWGGPLVVLSGWRSQEWNRKVGGADGSFHITGRAADITPLERHRVGKLNEVIEDMITNGELPALGGLGKYAGWTHVDCRPKAGRIARWLGKGMGSEE